MARRVFRKKVARKIRRRFNKKKTSVPRSLRNNHTMITRIAQLSDFTVMSNFAWTNNQYNFKLSDLTSYSEFTNLFDQYMISAVKVTFFPQYDANDISNQNANAAGVGTIASPIIFTTYTQDPTLHLNTLAQAMQVSSAKMVKNPLKPFSVYAKPKFITETANGILLGGSLGKRGYLDTDYPSIQHYGVEIGGRTYASSAPLGSPNLTYQVFAKFYLQFKQAI